jgi:hypothetical protein
MTQAIGMSWLKHKRDYRRRFHRPVPDWVCVYDLPLRLPLVRCAIELGWLLPSEVLIPDEFHQGQWSVWGPVRSEP